MRAVSWACVLLSISASAAAAPCGGDAVLISRIQGEGGASALEGRVVTVEAIVTASFPALDGYFVQEEDADADTEPHSSEGLFVYQPGAAPVPGERVRVTGTVAEFHDLTELSDVTELSSCGTEQLPRVTEFSLPVAATSEFEAVEGMLLHLAGPLVVADAHDLGRYGELALASQRLFQPTETALPGSAAERAGAQNLLARFQLDDGNNAQFPDPVPHLSPDRVMRAGDAVVDLTGVLDFGFGQYRLQPTGPLHLSSQNQRPTTPPDVDGALRVASFNVDNYFHTLDSGQPACGPDGALGCRGASSEAERKRQREKLVSAIDGLNADIVALLEVENDAGTAVADLARGVGYEFIDTGPIGHDAIKVALLYNPEAALPVGSFAILDSDVDERFDDSRNRPVLAQSFEARASSDRFTLALNHLKSKGSSCDDLGDPDPGDGQGNCNHTRTRAVQAELDWLAGDPTASGDHAVLALGDFNAYTAEDPVRAWLDRGYLPVGDASSYTYLYDGQLGSLDHAFASAALAQRVKGFAVWHINADELPVRDYHSGNPAGLYEAGPFRSSDHDPLVVGLFARSSEGAAPTAASPSPGTRSVRLGDAHTGSAPPRTPSGCSLSVRGHHPDRWLALFAFPICAARRRFSARRGR